MSEKIDIAKMHAEGRKFSTKDGKPVRIVCTDAKSAFNIVALVQQHHGDESIEMYTNSGSYYEYEPSDEDLILIPREVTLWLNVYKNIQNGIGCERIGPGQFVYASEKAAKGPGAKNEDYLGTYSITVKVE